MIVVERGRIRGRVCTVDGPRGLRVAVWDDGRALDRDAPVPGRAVPEAPTRPPAAPAARPPWLAGALREVAARRRQRRRGVRVPAAFAAGDLRARRAALGWSQRDLAAQAGVSRAVVAALELGARTRTTAATRDALEAALRRAEGGA